MSQSHDPPVLDVLIAGGGPGGTAVAFRAHELGLTARIIEYDDLMKRIRDYSKDKMILPGFGGGDSMKFPRGGSLIEGLRFAPIDKDDICASWKALHAEHGVEAKIGVELTGLERRADGVYEVQGWDHSARCDARMLARAVVVAIGRGVPRRFDIPGNTDGIAYRLDDPAHYVGQPACVVGGGTSAAEAVIAISAAKAAAEDPTAVYWSYRGDRMPRVSKALADVFFEAYVGCGNIRYHPRSEPAAILVGDDHREYLSVRVDRRPIAGRPSETTHFEFAKDHCLACIGEDIPASLLDGLGIPMVTGGPRNKKRMVVNRFLETNRENVFLVGDILSQAYFETADFEADPAGYREVKHRGNIKSALRDGVLVAEVIKQRLEGRSEIEVTVDDAEDLAPAAPAFIAATGGGSGVFEGPPAASIEPEREVVDAVAYLIRMLPGGDLENEHPIADHGVVTIGSQDCDLTFTDDTLLSPRHASVSHTADGCFVRDDGSAGGVYLRVPIHRKLAIEAGDLLCAGRQFLLVEGGGERDFEIVVYDAGGAEAGRHRLSDPDHTVVLGRQACDILLDAADRTLSRRHLALSVAAGKLLVKDLKSANGTFLRMRNATRLEHGDRFRVGRQTFVLSSHLDAVLDAGHESAVGIAVEAPAAVQEPEVANAAVPDAAVPVAAVSGDPGSDAGAAGPSVTFSALGKTFAAQPGQTICEVAEANGVALNAECHAGICGSDPIRILAGAEHLAGPAGDEEADTLEDLCGLKAGECRLACMARIRGPVTVEIVE